MKLKPEITDTILDVAESLFNTNSYSSISLECVAQRAGVSKRTLYKYFGDKNRLVQRVLQRRDQYFQYSLALVVDVFTEKKDKINAIIAWHIRWFTEEDYNGCMFVRALAEYGEKDKGINAIVKSHKQWIQHFIYQCLGTTKQSEDTSRCIALMLEGMIAQTALFGIGTYDVECIKKNILSLVESLDQKNPSGG